jgi:putative endonuclease
MEHFSKRRKLHLELGRFGEDTAVRLLRSKGYHILTRNFRLKSGELDIVALDGTTVVFAEVKTRRQNRFSPRSNLSFRQLKRNFATGKLYLSLFGIPEAKKRYDLIEVTVDRKRYRRIVKLTHSLNILMQL